MAALTKAIDVSKHNGKINWKKVKEAGYSAVIIRAGWTWYDGGLDIDTNFIDNIEGALDAGMDIGVYVYSYDRSVAAAKEAAKQLLKVIKPYKLTYPVYFDIEYEPWNIAAGKKVNTDICIAFLDTIEAGNYYAGLYCSLDFIKSHLEQARLTKYDKWIAQYAAKCTYDGDYGMWQHGIIGTQGTKGKDYTIAGQVPGLTTNCDVNQVLVDYPSIIAKKGLNKPVVNKPAEPNYKALYENEKRKRIEVEEAKANLIKSINTLLNNYK